MRKEFTMKYNDILAEAMDNLDEKYATETAKCFIDTDKTVTKDISIDAESLIETNIQPKKSNHIAKFAAIAAAFVCVASVSGFFIMNGNKIDVQGTMSSTTESSQITSDTPSSEATEKPEDASFPEKEDQNIHKDTDRIVSLAGSSINNMTKLDENTLLANSNYSVFLYDLRTDKIIKEFEDLPGMLVQKIDNGFVIKSMDYDNCYYEIYDTWGNLVNHVDIPVTPLDEEELQYATYKVKPDIEPFSICVSADGKSVVYHSVNGFCTNTVNLDNERVIVPVDKFNGGFEEFNTMLDIMHYEDDVIYGLAVRYFSETDEHERYFASMNVTTGEWNIYHKMEEHQQILNAGEYIDNSFIIIGDRTGGKLPYFCIGDNQMTRFVSEEIYESENAFISPNGKYILTSTEHSSYNAELKLYDAKTGIVLLTKNTYAGAFTAYIDEDARKLYVSCGDLFVMDF